MLLTILILLFVAQPVKGPVGDTVSFGQRISAQQHVKSEQKNDTAVNSDLERFRPVFLEWYERREKQNAAVDSERIAKEDEHKSNYDLANIILLSFTVIGTFTLAIVGYCGIRQASRDAKKQYTLASDTAERELRAYLFVTIQMEPGALGPIDRGFRPPRFQIKNNGKTPAHKVECWTAYPIIAPLNHVQFVKPSNDFTYHYFGSLHNDPEAGRMIVSETHDPSGSSVLDIKDGELMHYWGMVEYQDIFGESRYTEFGFQFECKDGRLSGPFIIPQFSASN